jgi:hypothetical protein
LVEVTVGFRIKEVAVDQVWDNMPETDFAGE